MSGFSLLDLCLLLWILPEQNLPPVPYEFPGLVRAQHSRALAPSGSRPCHTGHLQAAAVQSHARRLCQWRAHGQRNDKPLPWR
jgi:hypothetical protein